MNLLKTLILLMGTFLFANQSYAQALGEVRGVITWDAGLLKYCPEFVPRVSSGGQEPHMIYGFTYKIYEYATTKDASGNVNPVPGKEIPNAWVNFISSGSTTTSQVFSVVALPASISKLIILINTKTICTLCPGVTKQNATAASAFMVVDNTNAANVKGKLVCTH